MNNFLGRLSHMKDALSKSGNIMNNVRKSVGILTVATAASMGSGVMAGEWHTVDTKGIGPEAFCMQKFGNKEWKLLVDDQGRNVLKPDKDLQYRGKYTQKPVASGQGDATAKSAARIVSNPRPQPKPKARVNISPIGEKSEGTIKEKKDAQTNSLNLDKDLKKKPDTKAPKKFEILSGFDMDKAIEKKNAEKIVSQVIQLKSEGRKNEELLCENPDSDKNSKIIKEVSQLDLGTLIAIPPKETFPKTQIGPTVPGNIFSIQEARAMRKSLQESPNANMDVNIPRLKQAIAYVESGDNYGANNIKEGKKRGIRIGRWALGKYAIIIDTAKGLGGAFKEKGKDLTEQILAYLKNHKLQESHMDKIVESNIKIAMNNPKIVESINNGKTSIVKVLAKMHFAGPGSIKNQKEVKDWMGTPESKYENNVQNVYDFPKFKADKSNSTTTVKSTNSKKSIPTIQAIQPEIKIPTIQESKEDTNKPDIQAIAPQTPEISSLILAPKPENIINTAPSANDTIFATQQVTQSVISLIDEKRIQVNKLMEIEQSHLESAKVHRMEATRLRKEAKNRFGNNWELSRKRLNKQAETHESNAEAHESRANALNNTIMRMSNNQSFEKAA